MVDGILTPETGWIKSPVQNGTEVGGTSWEQTFWGRGTFNFGL